MINYNIYFISSIFEHQHNCFPDVQIIVLVLGAKLQKCDTRHTFRPELFHYFSFPGMVNGYLIL